MTGSIRLPSRAATLDEVRTWLKLQDAAQVPRAAAERGDADATATRASYTDGSGVPQDHAEAARWYRRAADQGHPQAQLILAASYAVGYDLEETIDRRRREHEEFIDDASPRVRALVERNEERRAM